MPTFAWESQVEIFQVEFVCRIITANWSVSTNAMKVKTLYKKELITVYEEQRQSLSRTQIFSLFGRVLSTDKTSGYEIKERV